VAKYDDLQEWLKRQSGPAVEVSFEQLETLTGGLPPSAYDHRSWWSNEIDGRHVQARAWLSVGWLVEDVRPPDQVRFRNVAEANV
jgi:hypothetical protein